MYNHGCNVAKALKTLEPVDQTNWPPELQVTTSVIVGNDPDAVRQRAAEDRQFEIIFKRICQDIPSAPMTMKIT